VDCRAITRDGSVPHIVCRISSRETISQMKTPSCCKKMGRKPAGKSPPRMKWPSKLRFIAVRPAAADFTRNAHRKGRLTGRFYIESDGGYREDQVSNLANLVDDAWSSPGRDVLRLRTGWWYCKGSEVGGYSKYGSHEPDSADWTKIAHRDLHHPIATAFKIYSAGTAIDIWSGLTTKSPQLY